MPVPTPDRVPQSPSDDTNEHLLWMLRGLATGSDEAYAEVWRQFGERLLALARSRLPSGLRNRLEADDIVQSAYRSFFRRMTGGELEVNDSENLWPLLCAMTLNKVRMQIRFHTRQRRSPRRETPLEPAADDSSGRATDPESASASPEELAMFAEQFDLLMSGLPEEERKMVELKLHNYTNEEIAAQLGCSDRTVRRLLRRVRDQWKTCIQESLDGQPME